MKKDNKKISSSNSREKAKSILSDTDSSSSNLNNKLLGSAQSQLKKVPTNWQMLLDGEMISRSLSRIGYEILERHRDTKRLAIVGIRTCGEFIAKRLHAKIEELSGAKCDYGVIDITLYRDDLHHGLNQPTLKGTEIPFHITGSRIVIIDDVFFTGRTVRAALDAIIDFGRPSLVELAVLADRGHREFPLRPDYVGKNFPTQRHDLVKVRLSEQGYEDGVYLIENGFI
jgi:pyrimidine operon attenuation protein/uracil phosphoribosyltransferase